VPFDGSGLGGLAISTGSPGLDANFKPLPGSPFTQLNAPLGAEAAARGLVP